MLRENLRIGFLSATSSKGGYSAVSIPKHINLVEAILRRNFRSASRIISERVCLKRAGRPLNETLSAETVLGY